MSVAVSEPDPYPAQLTRVTLTWVAVGLVLFPILALLGVVMRTLQAGYFAATPPEWFYAVMTLHGLGMVGVWFVAGLAEGSFPAAGAADPLLSDERRRTLGLPPRSDPAAEERYLFYACVSKPERSLHLSYPASDEAGTTAPRSAFVDEVRDLLAPPPTPDPADDPLEPELVERATLADFVAAPEDANVVVRAAVDALAAEGVDVILSNQSHLAWCAALRRNAFLAAPSNFVFAPSSELAKRIRAVDPEGRDVHLTRGDDAGGPLTRAAFSARRVRRAAKTPREDHAA